MHREHDHGHGHSHDHDDNDHGHHHHDHAGPGHNRRRATRALAQWQTPHLDPHEAEAHGQGERDLDKVEAAFIEGFLAASDPTSFLRLAGIPFEAPAAGGGRLSLLRVETDVVADIGSLTPHLGGRSFRYDALPAQLVSRRRRLRFVYFDGQGLKPLSFAEARQLAADAPARTGG